MEVTIHHYVALSAILFTIGAYGLFTRRNLIVMFLCLELMLNAVNLTFVTFSRVVGDLTGQIFMLMSVTVAAAEVAIGLAFAVLIYNNYKSLDIDLLKLLKG